MFWNVFQPPPDVGEALSAVYRRVLPDLPVDPPDNARLGRYSLLLARAAEGIRAVGGFSDPEQWRFDWERPYTRDEWLDQVPSSRYTAAVITAARTDPA